MFHDVSAISPGEDYKLTIDRALADCDAALVVIAPGWLTAESPQGAPVELHDETWRDDVEGLIKSLRGEPAVPANRRRRLLAAGIALIALFGLGAGAWLLWGPGAGGNNQQATAIPSCVPPASQDWSAITLSKVPTAVDKADSAASRPTAKPWTPVLPPTRLWAAT